MDNENNYCNKNPNVYCINGKKCDLEYDSPLCIASRPSELKQKLDEMDLAELSKPVA